MSDAGEGYHKRVAAAETIKAFGNEAYKKGDYRTADAKYTKACGSLARHPSPSSAEYKRRGSGAHSMSLRVSCALCACIASGAAFRTAAANLGSGDCVEPFIPAFPPAVGPQEEEEEPTSAVPRALFAAGTALPGKEVPQRGGGAQGKRLCRRRCPAGDRKTAAADGPTLARGCRRSP